VFTYLISNIGENLTQKNRDEIPENDLPEMEQMFAMFSAIKNDKTAYPRLEGPRCKILDPDELKKSKHWRIEKWWSDEELKRLGLLEEGIDLNKVIMALDNTKDEIKRLIETEYPLPDNINFENHKVSDIFNLAKGNSKYTKKYFKTHRGAYPVYSSQTSDDGIIAFIDTYDFDETQCLTWTTDGVYAGTVFLREGKFSMTTHCGALIMKEEWKSKIYLPYVYHILKGKLRRYAVGQEGQNKRVTVGTISDIDIDIPTMYDGTIDMKVQQEIALKFSENELLLDRAMKAKDELVQILNKALPK
jgi:restriction endonuclease S subunit